MRTFACTCGNPLFFENTCCLACGSEVGWCPACRSVAPLAAVAPNQIVCARPECGAGLQKCCNYLVHDVCNRCLEVAPDLPPAEGLLCDYCHYNDTIPDLNVPGNRHKWYRLEQAKRRLLYTLDLLGLSYGRAEDGVTPGLSFDFKADLADPDRRWRALGPEDRVYTGYADGKITINLREADPVEREKARVSFDEAHRTLIGHFRHEIGHYYHQMLVRGQRDEAFRATFGDPDRLPYAEALARHYREGPRPGWPQQFVSGYASMHPWEDFAESLATYLDMASVLDTAWHMGFSEGTDPTRADLDDMAARYRRVGILVNELNRAMGITDLVPEMLAPSVVEKLRWVDGLVRENRLSTA